MGIQFKVRNFRCLRNVDWSPDGVCLLVGPNGSGKTTLLDALSFLKSAYETNPNQAIATSGGAYFRNLDAPTQEAVSFGLSLKTCTWEVDIFFGAGPFNLSIGETVTEGAQTILMKRPEEPVFKYRGGNAALSAGSGLALRMVTNMNPATAPLPIVSLVTSFIVYGTYALPQLRQNGSPLSADMQLSPSGLNAFAVLRNWRDKRDYRPAYEFVVQEVSNAFPGVADELEFDFAGNITSLRLANKRRVESIPVALAPNGWLAGLLHLMAVAGAKPGTMVAIDEFENSLHPYAIRRLVQAMRDWATNKQLTVALAGHSLALLDEFGEDPSRVFVMEPWRSEQPSMPLRLTDYRDPEWLKHFSLGELYRHEDFGGPKDAPPRIEPALSASPE